MTIYPAYTYTHKNKITGEIYHGYRRANKLQPKEDLPIYVTSNKELKKKILQNPEEWSSEVTQTFLGKNKNEDAFWAEQENIKRDWKNPLLINGYYLDKEKGHKVFDCDSPGPKGKRCYNNGSEHKFFFENEQPDGWTLGRLDVEELKQHFDKINFTKNGGSPWNKGKGGSYKIGPLGPRGPHKNPSGPRGPHKNPMTPEAKKEARKKAWETRRAKALLA